MNSPKYVSRQAGVVSIVAAMGLFVVGVTFEASAAPKTTKAPAAVKVGPPVQAGDLPFDEILFVKRMPYSSNHYYTDINNGTSADRFVPGNGIFIHDLRTGKQRPVVTAAELPGGKGFIGKTTLSFDAKKVLFDFRENPKAGFRIWEVGVDGKGLRQVTRSPANEAEKVARWGKPWHTDDVHPCYLPDGRILFSSSRSERTVLCGGSAHLVAPTLHVCDADGKNVKPLTASLISELCPVILDDGRIMYHRWEYIDKGARVAKTIWAMQPDGTRPQELYGLADDTTTVYVYPQPLPGGDGRIVSAGSCHFPQGGCLGAIMLIDPSHPSRCRGFDPDEKGYVQWDDRSPVINLTPHVFTERRTEPGWHQRLEDGTYVHDRAGRHGHLYTHPWPVTDRQFLVSFKVRPHDHYKNVPDAYALYLLDANGTHRPILKDDKLSCWHAVGLKARRVPPVLKSVLTKKPRSDKAVCVLTNVYHGMSGVKPGEIRYLRVNEALPRYWATGRRWGHSNSSSSWKGALWPRVQWGIVPVEADGSAYFEVPADRNIFLQALDKNFREIQRERTYVNFRPGEVRSCTGCHGDSGQAMLPTDLNKPLALQRPPSKPAPQPCDLKKNGGDGKAGQVIHYPTDIQPILNAKCVSCHSGKTPSGKLTLTGDLTRFYSTSYEQLASKELAGPILPEFTSFGRGDRGNYNGAYLPPKSLGSYKSVLMKILTDRAHPKNGKTNHAKLLTANERMILSRWVDSNYQFYGSYYGRQHSHWADKPDPTKGYKPSDFRRKPTFEEAISDRAPKWHR